MDGRGTQLSSYGFVFKREFLIENSAHAVTYVNSYHDLSVRRGYDQNVWKVRSEQIQVH